LGASKLNGLKSIAKISFDHHCTSMQDENMVVQTREVRADTLHLIARISF
jgi:hypothetical protein